MTVAQNQNFKSVRLCNHQCSLNDLLTLNKTHHIYERQTRFEKALYISKEDEVDRVFRVDKGHPNGAELHFVTKNGCIYICNERTMKLITVLLARRNQVKRLYDACNVPVDEYILEHCDVLHGLNLNK